jgi:hypothetical protein
VEVNSVADAEPPVWSARSVELPQKLRSAAQRPLLQVLQLESPSARA